MLTSKLVTIEDFYNCVSFPHVFTEYFDRVWHLVGEVPKPQPQHVSWPCDNCLDEQAAVVRNSPVKPVNAEVTMERYELLDNRGVRRVIYFGICPTCQSVFYAG